MARLDTCDVCGKPAKLVAKIFIGPARQLHSKYTASADIGECCLPGIQKNMNWKKRGTYKPRNKKPEKVVV